MPKRHFLPFILVFFAAVLLFLPGKSTAFAAMPETGPEKGILSAASTAIERSGYTDGSQYENEPANVDIVKIGLRYGDDGVYCFLGCYTVIALLNTKLTADFVVLPVVAKTAILWLVRGISNPSQNRNLQSFRFAH